MGYKEGDAIDPSLYWMLFRRGLVHLGDTPPSSPQVVTEDEWDEICAMVEKKTRHVPVGELKRWLRLTAPELERLGRGRGDSRENGALGAAPASTGMPWENEPFLSQVLRPWEFRRKYNLSRAVAAQSYSGYFNTVSIAGEKARNYFAVGKIRIVRPEPQTESSNAATSNCSLASISPKACLEVEEVGTGVRHLIAAHLALPLLLARLQHLESAHG